MTDIIVQYQWELFIGAEIISWLSLVAFLLVRYAWRRQALSGAFLLLFIVVTLLEAVLAFVVYRQTGEINTFQMVVALFLVYACTFGISDFKKLDRYIKQKVGKWQGVDLLTEKDRRIMQQEKDPRFIARSYRRWWYGHALVFVIAHYGFWLFFGNPDHSLLDVLTDWSWLDADQEIPENGPYEEDVIYQVSAIWAIVFIIDTIYSWSYTIFPEKDKKGTKEHD